MLKNLNQFKDFEPNAYILSPEDFERYIELIPQSFANQLLLEGKIKKRKNGEIRTYFRGIPVIKGDKEDNLEDLF